jgi:hypothetical protein
LIRLPVGWWFSLIHGYFSLFFVSLPLFELSGPV